MNVRPQARTDRALVLARGASRRLGRPKGLAVAADDDRPLLVRVVDLYRGLDLPVLVVAGPDAARAYARLLSGYPDVTVHEAAAGGGTARTVGEAWSLLSSGCTHLWAHPVDVPGVGRETLRQLRSESVQMPDVPVRPRYRRRPGHPVILPAPALNAWDRDLDGGLRGFAGEMRELLAAAAVHGVETDDAGVTRDCDTERDLAAAGDPSREPERRDE